MDYVTEEQLLALMEGLEIVNPDEMLDQPPTVFLGLGRVIGRSARKGAPFMSEQDKQDAIDEVIPKDEQK